MTFCLHASPLTYTQPPVQTTRQNIITMPERGLPSQRPYPTCNPSSGFYHHRVAGLICEL